MKNEKCQCTLNYVINVPQDVQKILSSHIITKKYNEQEVFYKTKCS